MIFRSRPNTTLMRTTARALLFVRLACLLLAALPLTAADHYQLAPSSNQNITEWSTCKKVTNNHASGQAIFIPTNTSAEWAQFYNNPPPGVSIAACGCTVSPGSQNYTTAGTSTFTVPCYNTLTVTVYGAGAGGTGTRTGNGTGGGASSFNGNVIGNGGNPGVANGNLACKSAGTGGTGVGGTTNVTGGSVVF